MKANLHLKVSLCFLAALCAGLVFIKSLVLAGIFLFIIFNLIIYFFVTRPLSRFSLWVQAVLKGGKAGFKPVIFSQDEIGRLGTLLRGLVEKNELESKATVRNELRSDAVFSAMIEGVVVTDKNGQIILMNTSARKMFLANSSSVGKKIFEVILSSTVAESADMIFTGQEHFVSCDIAFDGGGKVLQMHGCSLVRENKLEGAVFVFHDLSELKRLEEVRKEFVANVSHELRTPIASIKGYAETLLDGALDDKAHARDFIQTIHDDAGRLNDLVVDLLDLARIEAGKLVMNIVPLDMSPVVKKTLNILDSAIQDKKLSIDINIAAGLPLPMADEKVLARIFLNLLDNAVKYNVTGGKITIRAVLEGSFIRVEVADSGVGIPQADLSRIFERFYRVDKSRSKELGGTGLGLSIVKHLVSAQGGKVWVDSVLGKGSTFNFTLPTE